MIPAIDPKVKYVGVSYLRRLNLEALRQLEDVLVVTAYDGEDPQAVILPYKLYLKVQRKAVEDKKK